MPKRPQTHRIESESVSALSSLMNSNNWVFEGFDNDYGIDGRIEMFHDDDATGKIFLVQIKGTGETDTDKALKLSLDVETIAYWLKINIPVCLVRYVAPSQKFYFRWINHFPEIWTIGEDQATVTLHWSHDDEFRAPSSFERIEHEFDLIERIKAGRKITPLSVSLGFSGEVAHSSTLLEGFSNACQGFEDLFFVRRNADLTLTVSPKSVDLSLNRISSRRFTLPLDPTYSIDFLPFDFLAMVGFLLLELQMTKVASRIFVRLLGKGAFLYATIPQLPLQKLMTDNLDHSELLQYAEYYLDNDDLDSCQLLLMAVTLAAHSGDKKAIEQVIALNRKLIKTIYAEGGDKSGVSTVMYNLASSLRTSDLHSEALILLDLAAVADPEYHERYHWWMERGRNQFLSKDFLAAQHSYLKSYQLVQRVPSLAETAHEILLFAADAAFYGGHFDQALTLIHTASAECVSVGEQFLLVQFAAREFLRAGFKRQKPQAKKAAEVLQSNLQDAKRVKKALEFDVLNPDAWLLKALYESREGHFLGAARAACVAALLNPEDKDICVLAASLLTHIQVRDKIDYSIFLSIVIIGHQYHGNDFWGSSEKVLTSVESSPHLISELQDLGDEISRICRTLDDRKYVVPTPWGVTHLPWMRPAVVVDLKAFAADVKLRRLP